MENIHERERGSVWAQQIDEKANGAGEAFVEAERAIGPPGVTQEERIFQELHELISAMQVFRFVCESIHGEENVCTSSDAVTNSGPFEQEAFLPHQIRCSSARLQVALVSEQQKCFCGQVNGAGSTVTPMHYRVRPTQ